MAQKTASGLLKSFRKDPAVQQYFLDGVAPTGKTLGVGSYGTTIEVNYNQVTCVAKKFNEQLLDPGNKFQDTIRKYSQQCQMIASLYHPNIIKFVGLYFSEESDVPLLIMERLKMNVGDLVEHTPDISLLLKVSILTDTCCGLDYLHSMPSPIVHGNLTATNVLLTSYMSAKLSDIGSFRMVMHRPDQMTETSDQIANVYMPPEAFSQETLPSFDIFSFGHLALFILTQVFPGKLLSDVGHTKVERRSEYMKTLKTSFLESRPVLVKMVMNCLQNIPEERPSSEQLLKDLQLIKNEVDKTNKENIDQVTCVTSLFPCNETKQNDEQLNTKMAFSYTLDYQSGPDMPVGMDYGIQAVEINGTIFVGGGNTNKIEDLYTVMTFNMNSCIWRSLPPYKSKWFALSFANDNLIIVGGLSKDIASDMIGEWQPDSNQWMFPFPPMSMTRIGPSATSYKHWLVVAGGSRHGKCLNSVEVLDVDKKQWFSGSPTPIPMENMKCTTIDNTWYFMGGWDGEEFNCDVYSVSLDALVSLLEV